jgi:acetyl esterase/lipase
VAQRGAVVFVPDWGRTEDPSTLVPAEFRGDLITNVGDIAAVVRFARGTGTRYGGDPEQLTLFGHSAGAMQAAVEAFSGASASPGGLEGAGSATPDSLVLFDGDWLLADPMWDTFVTADPGFMKAESPWPYLGRRFDFPITVLGSGDTSLSRPLGDPWAKDSWLQVRDPSGDIRRGLEELGALAGDRYVNESVQQLLVERLKADGDTVTYVRFTDSKHTLLGRQGLASLVDACVPNTQP